MSRLDRAPRRLARSILLVLLLLLLPAQTMAAPSPLPIPAEQASGPTDPAELEAFLDGVMASHLESHHIPGAVVAVVKDGELFFAGGYGYADLEQQIPVDAERTLFRPGSVSKLFTWTAVMQLVEQGRLDLHTDVNQYLDFEIPDTYPEPITLAHLMTHTPGFEDRGQGLFVLDEEELILLEEFLKSSIPERVFPPGEIGAYSNYGTALAGYIVQRVSGEPFETHVERHILQPLGMTRSTFRQPLPPELADDMARGYGYSNGAYYVGQFELVPAGPAGSLSAPATDMARFMIAYLQNGQLDGQRILEADTVSEMQAAHFVPDPRSNGMGYGFFRTRINDRLIIHHEGDTILFHTGLYLLPEENVGLFVSYNSAGGVEARPELLAAFMDRYYPVPEEEPIEPPSDFDSRLPAYVGEYHMARASYSTVEKLLVLLQPIQVSAGPEDGTLLISIMGEADVYAEVEPGLFEQTLGEERVIFVLDEQGQVTSAFPADVPVLMLFKAPWYATLGFTGTLIAASLLLFVVSMLGWLIAYLAVRSRGSDVPVRRPARLARWLAVLFSVVLLVFLLGFSGVMGNVDPAYGVPDVFFGEAEGMGGLVVMTYGLALLAIGMLVMAVIAWARRYWGWFGRIHYTLLALTGLAWVWLMAYWNILGAQF